MNEHIFDILKQNYPGPTVVLKAICKELDIIGDNYTEVYSLEGSDKTYCVDTHFFRIVTHYSKGLDCTVAGLWVRDDTIYNKLSNVFTFGASWPAVYTVYFDDGLDEYVEEFMEVYDDYHKHCLGIEYHENQY